MIARTSRGISPGCEGPFAAGGPTDTVGRLIGKAMEADLNHPEVVENVRLAARLHDVGMIGIQETVLSKPTALTEEEFDKVVYDLTNFLVYLAEPARLHRETIGGYVLFFLAFLFVFVYMLNREYWKDVH